MLPASRTYFGYVNGLLPCWNSACLSYDRKLWVIFWCVKPLTSFLMNTLEKILLRTDGMTQKRPYESKREQRWLRTEGIWNQSELTKSGISGLIFSVNKTNVDATVAWGTVGSGSLEWKEIHSQKFQAQQGRWKRGPLIATCRVDVNISFMLHNHMLTTELN